MSGGAALNRYKSEQDVGTPRNFIDAVERRFGSIVFDLAASSENTKAQFTYFSPDDDSLSQDWARIGNGVLWLNPPFSNIAPWAAKCAATSPLLNPRAKILLLVPASVGAKWFAEHVHQKAYVLALQGRLTFDGSTAPYPKDLVLAVYGCGLVGFDVWKWRAP